MNSKRGFLLLCPIHIILLSLFLFTNNNLFANNYYVDPSSTSTTTNGSLINPWKTIAQVNSGTTTLNPGDSVFFKRGQIYSGRLNITRSGNELNPIVYTNYGVGNLPEFDNAVSDIINLNGRQYVIIDGIKIIDNSISTTDHSIQAKVSYAINLNNSPNCTIRNCDISLVGIGIAATTGSNYTTITGNYIHNLRMVRNTPTSINANDDYGANPMVIGSSNNFISKNRFEECWANSYDYGYDGGAVEFFGTTMNNNNIIYNTAINCNGFIEIGSSSNGIAQNNIIAYNKIINCGIIGAYQNGSRYTVTINNIQYYNNTVVETEKKYSKSSTMFWMAGTGSAGMIVLKNNIFWLSSGVNFASSKFNTGQMIHMNNIYRMDTGILAITIDNSELLSATEIHFVDTAGDPSIWDYNLVPTSSAINFGIDLGYVTDFVENSIIGNPDAGILEYMLAPVEKPLTAKTSFIPLDCITGTTSATVTVSGGKPPYVYLWNTVPEQTTSTATSLVAGNYSVLITDSVGTSITSSITIGLPDVPTAPTLSLTQPNCIESTGKITVVSPIGNGLTFSIDGITYQGNTVFANLLPGNYLISAKNSLGCISTSTEAIINANSVACSAGIFNTNTTCSGYQSGASGQSLSKICYTTRSNKISSVSPSQFIYYSIITAPSVNFCVDVVQTKTIAGFRFFGILQRTQIYLWGNTCTRISTGNEVTSGQGRICITNAQPGTKYILSVKYDARNITGSPFTGTAPTCQYFFESRINGVAISGSNTSINLSPNCLPSITDIATASNKQRLLEENSAKPFDALLTSNLQRGNFKLTLNGATNEAVTIRIFDMYGRELQKLNVPVFQTIELGERLSQGIYAVEVSQGINKKVMKVNKIFSR